MQLPPDIILSSLNVKPEIYGFVAEIHGDDSPGIGCMNMAPALNVSLCKEDQVCYCCLNKKDHLCLMIPLGVLLECTAELDFENGQFDHPLREKALEISHGCHRSS